MEFKNILIIILIIALSYLAYNYFNLTSSTSCDNKVTKSSLHNKLITSNTHEKFTQYDDNLIDQSNNIDQSNEIDDNLNIVVDEYIKSKARIHVFMDISINDENIGKVIIELFNDIVPLTVDNFVYMIKNNYKGSIFHRIIKDFIIQGGDYLNGDGTGINSIYGQYFKDENFILKHDNKYIISMANAGPDTNGCQFFITLNPTPSLDNKHVVFGKIVGEESQMIIDKLGEVLTNDNDMPIVKCIIEDCGILAS
jgi:cyclophilin family peptidyl-prolyl cis-trans isomerase